MPQPSSPKQIHSDLRKAEIVRLLTIAPMSLHELRAAIIAFEPDVADTIIRATLYNMRSTGDITKIPEFSNAKNPTYSLVSQEPEFVAPILRGFAKPRRISADSEVMVRIMKERELRPLPPYGVGGCSLGRLV